jgi:hypothetical protein
MSDKYCFKCILNPGISDADPGCLFWIPDPNIFIPDPGSGSKRLWMIFSRVAVNNKVATVLGSIPASFDTVESEGRQINQC